ncbi:glycoside hydrolase family 3 protein [Neobacillus muris]|uniref:glycoside hydrolase family 3 protein n=1 Tax=Neobacillus muris TaxID=2941334 RepID=UPI00203B9001|nr:glycoside hydrolase family 3 protein [Neobacillus muris]
MKKLLRAIKTSLIAALLFIPVIPISGEAAQMDTKELVIDLNIPHVMREAEDHQLQLNALHVGNDGQFMLVSGDLKWESSNRKVASVKNGKVTLSGHSGRVFISVSDGRCSDQITLRFKGKQDKILIEKQHGNRYDVIGKAIKNMTIEEKVGQMLMPDFRTWNGENVTAMNDDIARLVKDYHLGGVILFSENTIDTAQTARLASAFQDAAETYALLVSIDQEGGIVTRLKTGTDFPGSMALGAARSEEMAERAGKAIGEELNALGINMNFGPVLDVNNNPDNPVIAVRSFSENPQLVADLGNAYIRGLHAAGTAATAKHFPGHGDTAVDSHIGLSEVPHNMERLKQVELYPFQKAMDAGIDAIMTAHVTFPKVDDTKAISKADGSEITIPATLSYKVLTELMRKEMGYNGVIVTDALEMGAITTHFGPVDAAIRAVQAGADILLMPVGIEAVAKGLYDAVNGGDISIKRIEESVARILTLKLNRSIVKQEVEPSIAEKVANALKVVGSEEHKKVEKEAAAKSITLVKNSAVLPLKAAKGDKIAVVGSSSFYVNLLLKEVKKHHGNVTYINTQNKLSAAQLDSISDAKYIIVGTYTSSVDGRAPRAGQMLMTNQLISQLNAPVIAVGIRNPYDVMSYPTVDAALLQYSYRPASFEATADTIFGKNNPSGKLPVTIYNQDHSVLYGFGHGLGY